MGIKPQAETPHCQVTKGLHIMRDRVQGHFTTRFNDFGGLIGSYCPFGPRERLGLQSGASEWDLGGTGSCKAMDGLLEGGAKHLDSVPNPYTLALMLIAHCLCMELYGIASYQITRRLAQELELEEEAELLSDFLELARSAHDKLILLTPEAFAIAQASGVPK